MAKSQNMTSKNSETALVSLLREGTVSYVACKNGKSEATLPMAVTSYMGRSRRSGRLELVLLVSSAPYWWKEFSEYFAWNVPAITLMQPSLAKLLAELLIISMGDGQSFGSIMITLDELEPQNWSFLATHRYSWFQSHQTRSILSEMRNQLSQRLNGHETLKSWLNDLETQIVSGSTSASGDKSIASAA